MSLSFDLLSTVCRIPELVCGSPFLWLVKHKFLNCETFVFLEVVLGNMFWLLCHIHFPTELRFFEHEGVYLQLKLDVAFGVKLTQCYPQKVQRH